MRYEAPEKKGEEDIVEVLSREDNSPEERIGAVLSAIYYGNTIEFSGDVLIDEFSKAKYFERRSLKNLFETFYGMCRTSYRIDDSIALLEDYRREVHEYVLEIDATLDALREYRAMFKNL